MPVIKLAPVLLSAVTATLAATAVAAAPCTSTTPVRHASLRGAFDFTYSSYDGIAAHCSGISLPGRIWQPAEASTTRVDLSTPLACREWAVNRSLDLGLGGAHPGQWVFSSSDLYHFQPAECASVDLSSARALSCPACDDASLDSAAATLRLSRSELLPGEELVATFEVDSGATASRCRLVTLATAEQHRYVLSGVGFDNFADRNTLLRDDTIVDTTSRPDLAPLFPLTDYVDGVAFPYTDEVGLLGDAARPLILYAYTGPETLFLVADGAAGVESVRAELGPR